MNNHVGTTYAIRSGWRWLVLFAALALSSSASASADYERERRLGEEMALNLFDGDVVTINDGERDFLAAFIDVAEPRGVVILLHGRGFHPDWPDVVGPLRVALAEAGWSTLSLQMPVLAPEAKYYDYVEIFPEADRRIEAGIRYARENVDGPLVLFAHSCGAHMAMHWIDQAGDEAIDALAVAGLGATDYGQDLVKPFPLDKIHVPMLDVLGAREYERVLQMAPDRKEFLQAHGHSASEQVFIGDADHYFKGKNADLARAVIDWLERLPQG